MSGVARNWFPLVALTFLAVASIAAAALYTSRVPLGWMFAANSCAVALAYVVAPALNNVITFANCWITNLTSISAVMLLRGRAAVLVPIFVGIVAGTSLALGHPDWDPVLVRSAFVTQTAIGIFGWLAMRYLRRFAAAADREELLAERNRRDVAVAESASRAAAESSRTLHDTVVNTLAAIAGGGRILEQRDIVRDRCAHDVAIAESLLAESAADQPAPDFFADVVSLGRAAGIDVRRSEETALAEGWEQSVPPEVLHALRGAVHEALLNVAKHSGSSYATVGIDATEHDLSITVTDDGVGYDATADAGYGINNSILARCREHGIEVTLTSAPMRGTKVALGYSLERSDGDATGTDAVSPTQIAATQARACWMWSASVVAVGVWIEFTNRFGTFSATWAMLGLVALTGLLAWLTVRDDRLLPWWLQGVLILSTPAAFVLSFAGVGFGHTDVTLWQILGTTVPAVILLYFSATASTFLYATATFIVVTAVLAAGMWAADSPYTSIAIVGGLCTVPVLAGFWHFHSAIERIGARTIANTRAAAQDRLRLETRRASDRARSRWRVAGLQSAVTLLQRIGRNEADPVDPAVQAACAREERYLRQLLMLSPELLHMGYWLSQASARARRRGVELALRTGDIDAPDDETARYVGQRILAAINSAPEGTGLTVSVFPHPAGGSLLMVGGAAALDHDSTTFEPPENLVETRQDYGEQFIIEITWRAPRPVDLRERVTVAAS
ncbi:sensor histidine kinase [Skermania sp. ID1734]|uniref:sensor histidine kinase n=1 Tax=Skermania sp. ID1734 TaxID=2597516 RepID=UPI00163DB26A|nr:ATP-binding protein [Skermania sp. ID1734]